MRVWCPEPGGSVIGVLYGYHQLLPRARRAESLLNSIHAPTVHRRGYGRRRGRNKAAVAVGHSLLVIVWHLLQHECPYVDPGSTYFDDRDRVATERRLVHRLEQLGYSVQLQRSAA
jgi:transposase